MVAEDKDVATAEEEDDDGGSAAGDGSSGRCTAEAEDGSSSCRRRMAVWRQLWKWVGQWLSLFFHGNRACQRRHFFHCGPCTDITMY